jgi:hypothetical protein
MTDKERIEKLVLTLMHLSNCMTHLRKMAASDELKGAITGVKESIDQIISINSEEIKLP